MKKTFLLDSERSERRRGGAFKIQSPDFRQKKFGFCPKGTARKKTYPKGEFLFSVKKTRDLNPMRFVYPPQALACKRADIYHPTPSARKKTYPKGEFLFSVKKTRDLNPRRFISPQVIGQQRVGCYLLG